VEIHAKEFWLPKSGNTKAEYEDAFHASPDNCRFAVADGATETSFSGIWAKQLVRAFTSRNLSVPFSGGELKPLQARWKQTVQTRLKQIGRRHPLPWYAEEKANAGAYAAIVGVEFMGQDSLAGSENFWRATAAGDSCLVQVRGDEVLKAFPLAESGSFGNSPSLLCSMPESQESGMEDVIVSTSGSWRCNDVFFLMTDALACWFFKEREQGNQPWRGFCGLDRDGRISFDHLVSELRLDKRMKNDDVTLVRIDVLG
jgi:hypothetical protein